MLNHTLMLKVDNVKEASGFQPVLVTYYLIYSNIVTETYGACYL